MDTTITEAIAKAEAALKQYDDGPSPLHGPASRGKLANEFDEGGKLADAFRAFIDTVKEQTNGR